MLLSRFLQVVSTMSDTSSLLLDIERLKESLQLSEETTQKVEKEDVIKSCNAVENLKKHKNPTPHKNKTSNQQSKQVEGNKIDKKKKVLRNRKEKKQDPKSTCKTDSDNEPSEESDEGHVILFRPCPPPFLPGMIMEW